ncbi:MAG: hypothetical protein HC924_11380, partial [Synechococcaceae cyanobacterium SM2_3_2]|nr:hypothetical protein [Synechococcaceae cyanobacterium SM2_3_2]
PYVDDTFRADNRFGPKPSYERPPQNPETADVDNDGLPDGCNVPTFNQVYGATAGQLIPVDANNTDRESLTLNEPPAGNLAEVGLDGYWERRSRREGLRVVVGQRLELARSESNPFALIGQPSDPNPLTAFNEATDDPRRIQPTLMSNEERQRIALRDNPASVQAAAVYHYSQNNGTYPVACLATVAHPGSAESLRRASSFPSTPTDGINFFTGEGTNVWEFEPPNENQFSTANSPLMVALRNLAFFAGDQQGAYPPVQVIGEIHPDPFLTAFGNFSELRRLFDTNGLIIGYNNLSLADRTTLHTAGCALGMLAWNLEQINGSTDPTLQAIAASITDSRDGDVANPIQTLDVREGRVIGLEGLLDNPASQRLYLPLWYIFPTAAHQDRNPAVVDPAAEPNEGANLIRRRFSTAVDTTYQYAVVDPAQVRFTPRASIGDWTLPHAPQACPNTTAGPNSSTFELIQIGNQCHRVPFKDTALYDGREAMALRVMNVDLALLTANVSNQQNALLVGDTWLPDGSLTGGGIDISEGGIFYAFREDAVREDAVSRPALTNFADFQTTWRANGANGVVGDMRIMNAGQPGRMALIGDPL